MEKQHELTCSECKKEKQAILYSVPNLATPGMGRAVCKECLSKFEPNPFY